MVDNFFRKRYSIRIVWLYILILSLIFLGFFIFFKFALHWTTKDSVDYTAKITLAIMAFLTLIYHLHNLENQIEAQKNSNKQNRAKYTYDICSDFYKPGMMDVNEELRCLILDEEDNLADKIRVKEFIKNIEDPAKRKQRQALIVTLNYFESISAMVLANDLDDEIVKRLFGKLFGRYYNKLEMFINYRQEESPKSWINYELLVKKWAAENKV